MRRFLDALGVATVAVAILIGGAHAQGLWQSEAAAPRPAPNAAPSEPVQASVQHDALVATVARRFGASIRVAPSLEAPPLFNAACGSAWPVDTVEGGWVKVRTEAGTGWIGAGRVSIDNAPSSVDCSSRRLLSPTADAWTLVPAGCLSLRSRPSDESSALACVANGHIFSVVDGPFDPGTGEDWFKVTSPATGTGWVPAESLYPR